MTWRAVLGIAALSLLPAFAHAIEPFSATTTVHTTSSAEVMVISTSTKATPISAPLFVPPSNVSAPVVPPPTPTPTPTPASVPYEKPFLTAQEIQHMVSQGNGVRILPPSEVRAIPLPSPALPWIALGIGGVCLFGAVGLWIVRARHKNPLM